MGCGESKHQVADGNTMVRRKSSIISRWNRGRETPQETSTKKDTTSSPEQNKSGGGAENLKTETDGSNTSSLTEQKVGEEVKNADGVQSAETKTEEKGGDVKSYLPADVEELKEGDEKSNVVEAAKAIASEEKSENGKECLANEKVKETEAVEVIEAEKPVIAKEDALVKETEATEAIIEAAEPENVKEDKLVEETEAVESAEADSLVNESEPGDVKEENLIKETEEGVSKKPDGVQDSTENKEIPVDSATETPAASATASATETLAASATEEH